MALCPYCNQKIELSNIRREIKGTIKKEVLYSCPHCDKVLGFGFFFGGLLTGRP